MTTFALVRFHIPHSRQIQPSKLLERLEDATELRVVLKRRFDVVEVLKSTSLDSSGRPNMSALLEKLKLYIPDAFNLIDALKAFETEPSLAEIEFSWTSGFTRQPERLYTIESFYFELGMVLMSVCYAQFNVVAQKMQSAKTSDNEGCKEAAQILCETAGIIDFLYQSVSKHLDPFPSSSKPVEFLSTSSLRALSCLAIAQAEEIGSFNAEERGMKSSLIAKLFIHASDLYRESQNYLETLLNNPDFPKSEVGLIQEYLGPFVAIKSQMLLAAALRHLAFDSKLNESHGLAVTYCEMALSKIEETKELTKSSALFSTKGDSLATVLLNQVSQEDQKINEILTKYTKENEGIYFESLPKPEHANIPNSTQLFKTKPFVIPAFSPLNTALKEKKEEACLLS